MQRLEGMGATGKVVVVTGASAGVGRATAREFAKSGASVALVARGRVALETARREVETLGGRALVCAADVSEPDAVEAVAERVERELGEIDVWVNNAMVSVFAPVRETTPEEYRRVTEVTYLGYVHGTLAALRRMQLRDRGVIVQVGSALAYRSIPLQSAYCAAKHAIAGFTESLRCELLHDRSRVKVVQVHLPAINTPQFSWVRSRLPNEPQPVPPIFQPEVAARAIAWAASHPRREILLGGPTLKANLAEKLVPGIADRVLARQGYSAQQTDEPVRPGRGDNLWAPIEEDRGAHGAFDLRARSVSLEFLLRQHAGKIALLAAGGALLIRARSASRHRSGDSSDPAPARPTRGRGPEELRRGTARAA